MFVITLYFSFRSIAAPPPAVFLQPLLDLQLCPAHGALAMSELCVDALLAWHPRDSIFFEPPSSITSTSLSADDVDIDASLARSTGIPPPLTNARKLSSSAQKSAPFGSSSSTGPGSGATTPLAAMFAQLPPPPAPVLTTLAFLFSPQSYPTPLQRSRAVDDLKHRIEQRKVASSNSASTSLTSWLLPSATGKPSAFTTSAAALIHASEDAEMAELRAFTAGVAADRMHAVSFRPLCRGAECRAMDAHAADDRLRRRLLDFSFAAHVPASSSSAAAVAAAVTASKSTDAGGSNILRNRHRKNGQLSDAVECTTVTASTHSASPMTVAQIADSMRTRLTATEAATVQAWLAHHERLRTSLPPTTAIALPSTNQSIRNVSTNHGNQSTHQSNPLNARHHALSLLSEQLPPLCTGLVHVRAFLFRDEEIGFRPSVLREIALMRLLSAPRRVLHVALDEATGGVLFVMPRAPLVAAHQHQLDASGSGSINSTGAGTASGSGSSTGTRTATGQSIGDFRAQAVADTACAHNTLIAPSNRKADVHLLWKLGWLYQYLAALAYFHERGAPYLRVVHPSLLLEGHCVRGLDRVLAHPPSSSGLPSASASAAAAAAAGGQTASAASAKGAESGLGGLTSGLLLDAASAHCFSGAVEVMCAGDALPIGNILYSVRSLSTCKGPYQCTLSDAHMCQLRPNKKNQTLFMHPFSRAVCLRIVHYSPRPSLPRSCSAAASFTRAARPPRTCGSLRAPCTTCLPTCFCSRSTRTRPSSRN
jgi:hypothetical protein